MNDRFTAKLRQHLVDTANDDAIEHVTPGARTRMVPRSLKLFIHYERERR